MKNQCFNPYLPAYEYVPDGEPHVFGDRLYVFGSHDQFGTNDYCVNDYVGWSCPTSDLSDWRYEGVIYKKNQHPHKQDQGNLYAPDVARGIDGRYYLYYSPANSSIVSVAVCDTPAGKYEYYGDIHQADGHILGRNINDWFQFDPSVLVDNDRRVWLYSGSGQKWNQKFGHPVVGAFVMELEPDMLTVKSEPKIVMPYAPSWTKPHFFEAASVRKIGNLYYLVYAASDSTGLHYCTSEFPDRDFRYRGRIHSTSDIGIGKHTMLKPAFPIGNSHGGIVCINGQYYIFDHRMTNTTMFSRQGVAESIEISSDGEIRQAESTSCGLNGAPLMDSGTYSAGIACNLFKLGLILPSKIPFITQMGPDRNESPMQYITRIKHNCAIGFKYFLFTDADQITVNIRGEAQGTLLISTDEKGKEIVAKIPISECSKWSQHTAQLSIIPGVQPLYFLFKGKGMLEFLSFTFK